MSYVHGYTDRETRRLQEQSLILEELLHGGTVYSAGSKVLEVGCGVGAQTLILLRRHPGIQLTSIDISEESLDRARASVNAAGYEHVLFRREDIMDHSLEPGSFDHLFVCFLLEHLGDPAGALVKMGALLKEGGTLTVIEGDHGSGCWTPETEASRAAWEGLVESQRMLGHDPCIGRRLYPLLKEVGFKEIRVEPRAAYADQSSPDLLDGAVNQIITPMVFSAREHVLKHQLVDPSTWKQGLEDLSGISFREDGTFFYSWFKGVACSPTR
jgi:ubiquinone/menaquinone biosynthesis C-methylase UbiE